MTVLAVAMVLDDGADAADVGTQFTVGDLIYEVTADGEVEVAATVNMSFSGDHLVIPDTVSDGTETYVVTSIGNQAFGTGSEFTSVIIPDSITSIGDFAFAESWNLTSIIIPDSVTFIGDYVFNNCWSLTSVTISNSVTSIGEGTFSGCYSLTSITIPDSVTSIGIGAFGYCLGLTSITIPDSVTSIGSNAFRNSSSIHSVTFESEVSPTFGTNSFNTGTTINIYTLGWDPVSALADAHGDETTIVWANPYSNLDFTSDPESDGILIPPGHHLVTFVAIGDGSTLASIVVEDGHVLELTDYPDYDSDAFGSYEIYDLATGGYVDMIGYVVTGNVVVIVDLHNGGNGDGGGSNPGGY